ncbi:MAG: SufE family protein [Gammaproteobacteria bacterium]|nr:SufE family protein [Gammaproteobacteria bacterium]MCP5299653.1 SufE family protein [Chromatiaceae bacterium]
MLTAQDVIDNFDLLDDWEARYAYLVELGEALPQLEDRYRIDTNKVKGCISQVWVCAVPAPDGDDHIDYVGDCDTSIIKGVLALLIELLSGHTAQEIDTMDVDGLFDTLKLAENLSPNRHFGIYAVVEMMKEQARSLAGRRSAATS